MYCPYCGDRQRNDAVYCTKCGKTLRKPSASAKPARKGKKAARRRRKRLVGAIIAALALVLLLLCMIALRLPPFDRGGRDNDPQIRAAETPTAEAQTPTAQAQTPTAVPLTDVPTASPAPSYVPAPAAPTSGAQAASPRATQSWTAAPTRYITPLPAATAYNPPAWATAEPLPTAAPTAGTLYAGPARVGRCESYISLRTQASTGAPAICLIPLGEWLEVLQWDGGSFARVRYKGYEGYALARYLLFGGDAGSLAPTAEPIPTDEPILTAAPILTTAPIPTGAPTAGPVPTEAPNGMSESPLWRFALSGAAPGDSDQELIFSLRDMDGDGQAELIVRSGEDAYEVYAERGGSAAKIGEIFAPAWSAELYYYESAAYPGLFTEIMGSGDEAGAYHAVDGESVGREAVALIVYADDFDTSDEYLALHTRPEVWLDEIEVTPETGDDALYALWAWSTPYELPFFTRGEVVSMGWDAFREACRRGSARIPWLEAAREHLRQARLESGFDAPEESGEAASTFKPDETPAQAATPAPAAYAEMSVCYGANVEREAGAWSELAECAVLIDNDEGIPTRYDAWRGGGLTLVCDDALFDPDDEESFPEKRPICCVAIEQASEFALFGVHVGMDAGEVISAAQPHIERLHREPYAPGDWTTDGAEMRYVVALRGWENTYWGGEAVFTVTIMDGKVAKLRYGPYYMTSYPAPAPGGAQIPAETATAAPVTDVTANPTAPVSGAQQANLTELAGYFGQNAPSAAAALGGFRAGTARIRNGEWILVSCDVWQSDSVILVYDDALYDPDGEDSYPEPSPVYGIMLKNASNYSLCGVTVGMSVEDAKAAAGAYIDRYAYGGYSSGGWNTYDGGRVLSYTVALRGFENAPWDGTADLDLYVQNGTVVRLKLNSGYLNSFPE